MNKENFPLYQKFQTCSISSESLKFEESLGASKSCSFMRFSFLLLFLFITSYGLAQSEHLARNYMDQGEYEKAESIYKKLYEHNSTSPPYFEGYIEALQEQKKYDEAHKVLTEFSQNVPNYPGIEVEIGHNYALEQEKDKAQSYYEQSLNRLEQNPADAYATGQVFRSYNLLEYAEKAYKIGLADQFNPNLLVELAKVYGEQGQLKEMFSAFLDLIQESDQYYYAVNRYFTQYIETNKDNKANTILRSILLKRIQQKPEIAFNRLLSWLFVQENNFRQAFTQEKAIYRRAENPSLTKIVEIAQLAADKEDFDTAEKMLTFNLEEQTDLDRKIEAHALLFDVKIEKSTADSYPEIKKEFEEHIKQYQADGGNPFPLQLQYAHFLAFKVDQEQEGLSLLEGLLKTPLPALQQAQTKMIAADILVLQERFSQALVYYTQVKSLAKNSPLAQDALFKIAKTSYYKGDFDWAQTQLKVLKHATSELTANDAIALHLLIEENRGYDSTQTALKVLAQSDLLTDQEQYLKAIQLTDSILKDPTNEGSIRETALFRKAQLQEKMENYPEAKKTYRKLIEQYQHSIYVDDALYHLAELYRTKLDNTEKAMENYKIIIFEHADSIFYVESRKKYRRLRGDDIL